MLARAMPQLCKLTADSFNAFSRMIASVKMDRKLKHLEFIQATVNRLSTNSFLLKGWSVVLVSALFVLSGKENNQKFAWLALIPAAVYWGLDGYFLWQERLYRSCTTE